MRELDVCFKYQKEIKKLTKANSAMIQDVVIYIVKKDHTGSSSKFFFAYDYKTKIQLHFHSEKAELIKFLNEQDFEVLK